MVDRCWYWKRTKILNHLNPWPNVLCFPSCEMVQWLAGHLPCWSFAKGQSPRAPWHCSKLTKLTNICAGTKVELMANQTSLYYYCIYIYISSLERFLRAKLILCSFGPVGKEMVIFGWILASTPLDILKSWQLGNWERPVLLTGLFVSFRLVSEPESLTVVSNKSRELNFGWPNRINFYKMPWCPENDG
jgi:hypothetical protein